MSMNELRRIDPGSIFNQQESKNALNRLIRSSGGGKNKKAQRAGKRRAKDEKFTQDWIKRQSESNLSPKARIDLALARGSDADVQFLAQNIDDIEEAGYCIIAENRL